MIKFLISSVFVLVLGFNSGVINIDLFSDISSVMSDRQASFQNVVNQLD